LVSIPQFVFWLARRTGEQIDAWRMETQGWSIQDHMAAAKTKEEEVQSLESRVQDMDKRIAHFEKKPYFDPKGIHRSGLKLISGTLKSKMDLLNDKIAWHYQQTDHAKLME
jgi:hypothetical protein